MHSRVCYAVSGEANAILVARKDARTWRSTVLSHLHRVLLQTGALPAGVPEAIPALSRLE